MNQIWNETDIVIVNGEEYLNDSASERLYQVYQDKLKPRGRQLYKLSWAEKVCIAVPRMYKPVKETPKPEVQEQELEGANEVFNLANAKKVLEDFDKEYSANPSINLVNYILTKLIKVVNVRPILIDDMIKFGDYIASQPQYQSLNWNAETLSKIIEEGQIASYYRMYGLTKTLESKADTAAKVISIIKLAQKAETLDVIDVVLASFLNSKDESFQAEVEGLLEKSGMTDILEFIKMVNHQDEEENNITTIEKFIIDAFNEEVANPQMSAEQWLYSLLDSIYIRFNVKASDVKDLIVKHVVDKPPFNIDILTLSRFVLGKDSQIKYCEKDPDTLIEELIISKDENEIFNNIELVHYNVAPAKWEEFNSKLAARIYTDLNSISVVDPVTVRKLYKLIIFSTQYYDKLLIGKLEEKFGLFKNELVAMATDALSRTRGEDPFEAGESGLEPPEGEEQSIGFDEEEELDVVSRRKPMTKEGKKKILYASIAGVGIISTLFLTFVQGYNPVTVVTECVKTFGALLKNNATLAQLGVKLGQLSVYFASVIVSFKSLFKFADTFNPEKETSKKEKKKKGSRQEAAAEEFDDDDYSFPDEDYTFDDFDDQDMQRVVKR